MALPLIPAIALGFFVTWLVLYGMTHGLQTWLASLLNALAHPQGSFWKVGALKAIGFIVNAAAYVFRSVGHACSQAAAHGTTRVAHYFGSWTAWIQHNAIVAGDFAEQTAVGFERLVGHTIPHAVAKAIAVPIHEVRVGLRHTQAEIEQLRRYARGIDRLVHHTLWPAILRLAHAVDITLPRTIGRVRSRVGSVEKRIANPSARWVKAIWKRGWILVGAGLMVKFLIKKFPWLFCRNSTNALKAVCGMDVNLLAALLADTALLTEAIDIREFAKALQAAEDTVVKGIHLIITAD